ncbi:MAG TPA: MBL fold metallo-hydrolase [Candidatus Limnocylindrales bacterium]|jgi:glyoxylase-like metal-dependent hydrolase (beta-lactamase superfamily II)
MELAPGIRRVGSASLVNSYLLEEGGEVTIIDAGAPGLWRHVAEELAAMGRTLGDVRAIVLTHGHSDHVGYAERGRREHGWPVYVHEADEALARGKAKNPAKMPRMRIAPVLGFAWWAARHGLLRVPPLAAVSTYGDGATLDLPGSPRVVLVPGHTPGSAALHVPSHGVVFTGDAMATYSPADGLRGPQVAAFTADSALARESLARLEGLGAGLVLPGHGDPFTGGIDEAVRLAREARLPG